MLASALNFAIGFFGYPFEGQYQQSITIEADGVSRFLVSCSICFVVSLPRAVNNLNFLCPLPVSLLIQFFFFPLHLVNRRSTHCNILCQFNNTFAPYETCPNARAPSKSNRSLPYVKEWVSHFLAEARERLSRAMIGKDGLQGEFDWTGEEVYEMMQMCAYEVRSLVVEHPFCCG